MDKRGALVAAGVEQLEEAGLGSFTQSRVAERAGLRQSHLTYYFPTRSDLVVAVADEAVRQRVAALSRATAVTGAAAKISALADVLTSPGQTRVLMALTQSADGEPGVRRALDDLTTGIAPLGAELLESAGIAATPSALALVQGLSTGLAVLSLARAPEEFRPRVEQMLTDLLTHLPREE